MYVVQVPLNDSKKKIHETNGSVSTERRLQAARHAAAAASMVGKVIIESTPPERVFFRYARQSHFNPTALLELHTTYTSEK